MVSKSFKYRCVHIQDSLVIELSTYFDIVSIEILWLKNNRTNLNYKTKYKDSLNKWRTKNII